MKGFSAISISGCRSKSKIISLRLRNSHPGRRCIRVIAVLRQVSMSCVIESINQSKTAICNTNWVGLEQNHRRKQTATSRIRRNSLKLWGLLQPLQCKRRKISSHSTLPYNRIRYTSSISLYPRSHHRKCSWLKTHWMKRWNSTQVRSSFKDKRCIHSLLSVRRGHVSNPKLVVVIATISRNS